MTTRPMQPPGRAISARALHFIWLADCSGSMTENGKIQALNHAIRETIPHMRRVADDNPNANVLIRALCFASSTHWHVARPTPVDEFRWEDVQAGGYTNMGEALQKVAHEMRVLSAGRRLFPPVLVLLSDGAPTDDFEGGLNALLAEPLGQKSVRIAIAIGEDADQEKLQAFIGDPARRPLQANNPETLVSYIKWASTVVVQSVSSPVSQTTKMGKPTSGAVPLPKPPPPMTDGPVW